MELSRHCRTSIHPLNARHFLHWFFISQERQIDDVQGV